MRTLLLVLVLLFLPMPLAAEGMQVIPMWERTTCGTEVLACYDFDQAQQIYKLDLKLQVELKKVELLEKTSSDYQKAFTKFDQIDLINQRTISNLQELLKNEQNIALELKKENLDLRTPSFFGRWYVLAAGAIVLFATSLVVGHTL